MPHGSPATPPAAAVSAATGGEVRSCTTLGTSHAWTLHSGELADGRGFFAKVADGYAEAPAAEAAGLRWLAEVPGGAAVPGVLAADGGVLVLERVHEDGARADAAADLGRRLALTHRAGAPFFGASWPGWLATLPLDNTPGDRWPEWYARRRLLPYLRDARDRGYLDSGDVAQLERVLDRIADLAGPDEPPARIHGDLWAGNVLWGRDGAVLIDPAAHGGHRESDLAMLQLFGAPHLDRILAAYDEAFPTAPGRRDRVPLHQLHPLLAHVCLFGRSYRSQLLDAARRLA
ncbi:fructosamine kinase family protein [Streptomonospora litoralis]|uniref:Fructosamine kinase n=1 Tax=Streptomonospora litoralis TaxID=2498135 RepID=A0A4P6Q4C7_9ACTN|nr:fructosamine kinase family protein [Streptomonospora litoralis]QBI55433.1 Fructosamine kinase [Streptomonospora litoralis]